METLIIGAEFGPDRNGETWVVRGFCYSRSTGTVVDLAEKNGLMCWNEYPPKRYGIEFKQKRIHIEPEVKNAADGTGRRITDADVIARLKIHCTVIPDDPQEGVETDG